LVFPYLGNVSPDFCPPAISAAELFAVGVQRSRVVIYPTGGRALVGRFEDVRREVVAFLGEAREQR